jgi:type I restriction enzyme M protein
MAIKKSDLYSSLWKLCDELRGGMDASQYKDYVLVLLFVKYVSDRAGHDDSLLDVPKGGSFKDLVALKGKPNIGDGVNKVIGKLAEANDLRGVIDVADFNDDSKLGKAQDMVNRVTNLIAIFENPALDFSGNTADGDDLLGDAYEYLMRNFATESGKSKGQFYTPAEVSRIMASVIGINKAKNQKETIYDPTCGSGSLLLKAHALAKSATGFDLAIYGQEMDNATAALSRMNMLIHNAAGAEIKNNNTLSTPEFKDTKTGGLKTFDYVVANPPFSVKSWTIGVNTGSDEFKRFEYGVPPEKNGDYAFLLHILASLKSTGKGAVILPHGVLFRGNAEGSIRKEIVKRGYIKGIIGLPANLFYGTGIPACVIIIDKEGAAGRTGIFMIDASKGFVKDGPKNRLRERDLHLIVDTFLNQTEVDKYSRMVPITEISDAKNDYNLNLPRYIDTSDPEDLHDLDAHLNGGIPNRDIDALGDFWKVLPKLRKSLFESAGRDGYSKLAVPANEVPATIANSDEFKKFSAQIHESLVSWATHAEKKMKSLGDKTRPKDFIADLSELLLNTFKGLPLVDNYEVYQGLMSFWEETLKDDVYMVIESGWEAGGKLTALPAKAKGEKRTGRVDYTIKKIEYRSELIPPELLIETFFADKAQQIESDLAAAGERLNELAEQYGGEEMLLSDYTNDKGEFTKKLVTDGLKVKGLDKEEKDVLQEVSDAFDSEAEAKKASKELEEAVISRYKKLTEAEIKTLLIQTKWIGAVSASIETVLDSVRRTLSSRLQTLANRYDDTLPTITTAAVTKTKAVESHLKKMGLSW